MVWKDSLSDQNAFIQILFYSAYFVLFRKTKINFNISQSVSLFETIIHQDSSSTIHVYGYTIAG